MSDNEKLKFERLRRAKIFNEALKKLFPNAKTILRFSNHLELLIAVRLSAQCSDKQVNKLTEKLFQKYKTLDDYICADPKAFEKDLSSVNFYKSKARHILEATRLIKARFNGAVPNTIDQLLEISGVGRKTANVILGNAFGIIQGIAVDTHVRRITRLYGLTQSMKPMEIEKDLMAVIPQADWFDFTNRVIEYGRKYCPARRHEHQNCPITKIIEE